MDASEEKNVTNDKNSLSYIQTNQHMQHNTHIRHNKHPPHQEHSSVNKKMHERITYIVLGLFVLIVLYGLYVQNYWLVGTLCFPSIGYGVYKIFDRYL